MAILKESFSYSSACVNAPNEQGDDEPNDPRYEITTPQAELIKSLESVPISEAKPNRQI